MPETIRRVMTSLGVLDNPAERLGEIEARLRELDDDPSVTWETHGDETVRLTEEYAEISRAIARAERVASVQRAAARPGNREDGADPGPPEPQQSAPAYIARLDRPESAGEVIARMGENPWRDTAGGPLAGHTTYGVGETGRGMIARALTALEGVEPAVGRNGAQKLAEQLLADSYGWPGVTVKRSRDEQADAAALVLALSSPYYVEAFRMAMRYPMEFAPGGMGFEMLTDEQRAAWRDVRTNEAVRASWADGTGATGGFALPLQLDDTVLFVNAGAAGPFRRLSRTVVGTSNTWNGITSQGATAAWTAEGVATPDGTPSIGQLQIPVWKETAWLTSSYEAAGDTRLDEQVPAFLADARERLEATVFATGSGSSQPFGVVTRAASDTATGALAAANVYGLLNSLGPRFRNYPGAKPSWLANLANINNLRQVPKFTGAVQSLVDDGQADGIPEMLSLDLNESSAMSAVNTTGAKNLLIGDFSQYVIVDRLPTTVVYDPIVFNSTQQPLGQAGWYFYARVGADTTTAGAAFGANAFSVHTV